MSKSQLQTNNTRLSQLITELQGKASGSSGGAVETCTVTVVVNAPISSDGVVYFTNAEMSVETGICSMMDGFTGTVAKGSLLALLNIGGSTSNYRIAGNCEGIHGILSAGTGLTVFAVNGDCTITFAG